MWHMEEDSSSYFNTRKNRIGSQQLSGKETGRSEEKSSILTFKTPLLSVLNLDRRREIATHGEH